jgi:hypothetical protein
VALRLKLLKREHSTVFLPVLDDVCVLLALEPSVFPIKPDRSVALDVLRYCLLSRLLGVNEPAFALNLNSTLRRSSEETLTGFQGAKANRSPVNSEAGPVQESKEERPPGSSVEAYCSAGRNQAGLGSSCYKKNAIIIVSTCAKRLLYSCRQDSSHAINKATT